MKEFWLKTLCVMFTSEVFSTQDGRTDKGRTAGGTNANNYIDIQK